ncbi:hypothetical protein Syun_028213 [Stephania yunnanensis]|uniref:Uncharacterized protein n=1 Tax=Stephania yunnanensis TaxID=152371 RepID=A0AAP0EM62_9MAGN
MVCHADMDMGDREAMRRYNMMTTVWEHKLGMNELHVTIRGYNVMSTDHPKGACVAWCDKDPRPVVLVSSGCLLMSSMSSSSGLPRSLPLAIYNGSSPSREAIHEYVMPSCLSTGVKLGRRPCQCASRGVVVEETRNSVEEEPGRATATEERGRADAEEQGPSSGGGGSRRRAATAEDRGGEQRRRRIAEASSVGGTGGRGVDGIRGRGAVLVASGARNVGAAVRLDGTRGDGKEGTTAAPEEKTPQRQRQRRWTTISSRGDARLECRRRALQRKDRAGESRSTSTMTVDDDGDGGGEACAVTGIVRRRRRPKSRFAERGVEEDGLLIFTLFWVATYQVCR